MDITIIQQKKVIEKHSLDTKLEKVTVPSSDAATIIKLPVPILDIQGYWTPAQRTPTQQLTWTIKAESSAVKDFPAVAFFNTCQQNHCFLALDNLINDTTITAQMNQETAEYDVTIEIPATEQNCILTIDQRPHPWQDCLNEWRATLNQTLPEFPEAAWNPVFCTWYAIHAKLTESWVEANAVIAAELGCGTLIIDDGWCFDTMKRVCPETIDSWYEQIGDWNLSGVKFPEFKSHVEKMQNMGLKYLLWVTPALIGNKSDIIKSLENSISKDSPESSHTLDPSNPGAAKIIIDKLASLVEKYQLDGLKVDFLDCFKQNIDVPCGKASYELVSKLSKQIRQNNIDALIEFRQPYATPAMLPLATQFRAGDVPFDFMDNFNRLCQIRVAMGDNIPVHSDPVFWNASELLSNISRHMIASLVGIPMLSMDLQELTPEVKAVVRHWLEFYQTKQQTLNHGHWHIHYKLSNTAFAMTAAPTESIIILNDATALPEALEIAAGRVYLLNLTGSQLTHPVTESFDGTGKKATANVIPSGGYGIIS